MDMIVTESKEYNVLLGNTWLKHVKAIINYENNQMEIKYDKLKQTIPITCMQRLNSMQFTIIDILEELELDGMKPYDLIMPRLQRIISS